MRDICFFPAGEQLFKEHLAKKEVSNIQRKRPQSTTASACAAQQTSSHIHTEQENWISELPWKGGRLKCVERIIFSVRDGKRDVKAFLTEAIS